MQTDHNLLFGVLALQADLLTTEQFVEGCSAWATRKAVPLGDLLIERGWLTADDVALVDKLLAKKLGKHGGDPKATLAAVMPDDVRRTLGALNDADVQATLVPSGPGHSPILISGALSTGGSRDRYTTTRLHATGGLGRVWLAHDSGLNRDVAMKELLPERSALPEAAARFLREARITGQLEHPGIVPIYELVHEPGAPSPFYTMRFIKGRTLGEAIATYHSHRSSGVVEPMELRELLSAFNMLCQAVAFAHSRRIIHRDLKPANVVLGDFGEVILLDWGIAKVLGEAESHDPDRTVAHHAQSAPAEEGFPATRDGVILGTPSYMAPEQARGDVEAIDGRTDIYGLGAILFEMLTGTVPFHGKTLAELLDNVQKTTPVWPTTIVRNVPKPLEAICLKCLSKAPEDRYADAKTLASDVAHFLADEPVTAYRDPLRMRIGRWSRRHRTLVSGLAAVVLIALPVLFLSLLLVSNSAQREKNSRIAADAARDDSEANFQKAVRAADLVSEELARGIKPIAGTQSKTVVEILSRSEVIYDELLAGPNPPAQALLNKAKLLVLVSEVYRGMNLLAPAMNRASKAIDICSSLVATEPAVREYRTTLAAAHHRRGWAIWDIGSGTKALAEFTEAIRLLDAAGVSADTDPEETYTLASCLTLSANIRLDFGDPAAAKPLFDRGMGLREAMYEKKPKDPVNTVQLATSCERLGIYNRKHGDAATALVYLRRAVTLSATAFAADRNNQEMAAHYIRTLNTLAAAEMGDEREVAIGRMKIAQDLAETFARRDPDSNLWEREAMRSRWSFRELDQRDWAKMPPEERIASRQALVATIQDIIRISDRRISLSSENVLWMSDRGNVRARLAVALLALASAGAEPEKNRLLALEQAKLAVVDYEKVLAAEPNTYEQKIGWIYAMGAVRDSMIAMKPDAAALAYHWKYSAAELRTHLANQRLHPENTVSRGYCGRAFFNVGLIHKELADNWLEFSADPAVREAMLDFAEALPDPVTIADPVLTKQFASARVRLAGRLRKVDEQSPLSERGKKLLESLAVNK